MATLVLGALGTLVGGPLGGAIGALAGRQIDSAILGGSSSDGPRLKDLAITTSSYGTPIPMHFGKMRAAGTIIWATDLQESSESSGGKGKPKVTSYSYSTSFAVALSSRPIAGIGRIWADGNLLRGVAGDLKAGGALRIYLGYGDQEPDPLLASALGETCPAYRNCAYVVFEDLQLEDFGNRIPALTFEIISDAGPLDLQTIVGPIIGGVQSDLNLDQLTGISYEGGSLLATLGVLDQLYPTASDSGGDQFTIRPEPTASEPPILLPQAASAWEEGDFGGAAGQSRQRSEVQQNRLGSIRYYDTGRDYQIGVQRPEGRSNSQANSVLDFPGALDANSARRLVNGAVTRAKWAPDRLLWRMAELDSSLAPGSLVQVPGIDGRWIVLGWEWRERAVELDLQRAPPANLAARAGDSGAAGLPADYLPSPTVLYAFELPSDGIEPYALRKIYAAIAGDTPEWPGSALFSEVAGELTSLGPSGRSQSTFGHLLVDLPPSPALVLECDAAIVVRTSHSGMGFASQSIKAIAQGRNRLLVGAEILQFSQAEKLTETDWRLTGLLRGRAGTEAAALDPHASGISVVLLDGPLIALDFAQIPADPETQIAAIGRGDAEPVIAPIENSGATTRPLIPVHPRKTILPNGDLLLCWTRRARGAWDWPDGTSTPLNEETEKYRVGIGDAEIPVVQWEVTEPRIQLSPSNLGSFAGNQIWVCQIGRIGQSNPLLLAEIP